MSDAVAKAESSNRPATWWQWLLVYPSLALGIIGSAPTVLEAVQSWRLDVPYGTVATARQSHAMFESNWSCLLRVADPDHAVRLPDNTVIQAIACDSGDILVRVDHPGGKTMFRWIARGDLVVSGSSRIIAPAVARQEQLAQRSSPNETVLCVMRQRDGTILRRLRLRSGECIEEVINPFNGAVVSRRPGPCQC